MASWGGGGSSHSKAKDFTPPQYVGLRGPFASLYGNVAKNGISALPGYTGGPLTATMSPEESKLLGINADLSVSDPTLGGALGMYGDTISGKYLLPDSNPFLAGMYQAAARGVLNNFSDAALNDRSAFTAAGQDVQGSSPFAYDRAIAERGLATSLGDLASQIYGPAYQAERANQLAAPGQAENALNAAFGRSTQGVTTADLPRLIAENGIERGLQLYQSQLGTYSDLLNQGASLTRPTLGTNSRNKTSGNVSIL